ncbi:hypothetical protein Mro03_61420 [Microbispora rosea subsp. rosea]|nr:hypothetical protein Mro03_61420 [Microbispora rosea subsp. rosea]
MIAVPLRAVKRGNSRPLTGCLSPRSRPYALMVSPVCKQDVSNRTPSRPLDTCGKIRNMLGIALLQARETERSPAGQRILWPRNGDPLLIRRSGVRIPQGALRSSAHPPLDLGILTPAFRRLVEWFEARTAKDPERSPGVLSIA